MGYYRAGFEVVGVDIRPQPRFPFPFNEGDALPTVEDMIDGCPLPCTDGREYALVDFDAIHASPPCQAFSVMKVMKNAREHVDLLTPIRPLLKHTGLPYVIENVPGAPMATVFRLCGTSFGLGVEVYDGWRQLLRHRYFETSFSMLAPPCQHTGANTIGFYGDHARDRRRKGPNGKGLDFPDRDRLDLGRKAMDMPWAEDFKEITEAIPPAYTEFIGTQLMAHFERLDLSEDRPLYQSWKHA